MVLDIKIKSQEEAVALNNEACKCAETLWVHADNDMIMVDARSLLGLCMLVGHDAKLVAEDDADPKVLTKVARRAGVNL